MRFAKATALVAQTSKSGAMAAAPMLVMARAIPTLATLAQAPITATAIIMIIVIISARPAKSGRIINASM
jgi:hypothetical protein